MYLPRSSFSNYARSETLFFYDQTNISFTGNNKWFSISRDWVANLGQMYSTIYSFRFHINDISLA